MSGSLVCAVGLVGWVPVSVMAIPDVERGVWGRGRMPLWPRRLLEQPSRLWGGGQRSEEPLHGLVPAVGDVAGLAAEEAEGFALAFADAADLADDDDVVTGHEVALDVAFQVGDRVRDHRDGVP